MAQTYNLSHSKDGFAVKIIKTSRFRETVATVVDFIVNEPFAHRYGWNYALCNKLFGWAWQKEEELLVLPITKEQARKIASPDYWIWDDEDEA